MRVGLLKLGLITKSVIPWEAISYAIMTKPIQKLTLMELSELRIRDFSSLGWAPMSIKTILSVTQEDFRDSRHFL